MKIRILYIVRESDMFGSNRSLLSLIDGIDKELFEVVGLVCQYHGMFCEEIKKKNIPVFYLPFNYSVYPNTKILKLPIWMVRYWGYEIYSLVKFLNIIRKTRPNIIHSNVSVITLGIVGALLSGKKHVWHIREFQDLDFHMKYYPSKSYFRRLLKRSYSVSITKQIQEHHGLETDNRHVVIYNGIMPVSMKSFCSKKENYYLFVGRIEATKGIEDLLAVFAKLYNSNRLKSSLYIAGDGNPAYIQSLRDFCDTNNISQYVEWLGMRQDCFELMKKAKALVVPSFAEAFGRVTAEALFAGCLVVGRNTAGTKEILCEKKIGLLFSSLEEMENHILDIEERGVLNFKDMIMHGQSEAVRLYSRESSTIQFESFYRSLFNR